jgi:DNA polymerase-3 subunit chi
MQPIEFHTGIDDPVGFAVRLLRKAYRQGARVLVTAHPATLERLSRQLWAGYEDEFIAHVRADRCPPSQAARTPLWLAPGLTGLQGEPTVVVNVGASAPEDPARLDRLIEVVSTEEADAAEGRRRWRGYKAAGLAITHVNAAT